MATAVTTETMTATDVRFEHYTSINSLGVHERTPRLSWRVNGAPASFRQQAYEIEVHDIHPGSNKGTLLYAHKVISSCTLFNPWPSADPLRSRQRISARVRLWSVGGQVSDWSEPIFLETGLMSDKDWKCKRITTSSVQDPDKPTPEDLFRKEFTLSGHVQSARLYITAQGVYEAEIEGKRVGDYFLAPGWTEYDDRLQYQTYDVTSLLGPTRSCLGVRIGEGWYSGRLGWGGGKRNIWGSQRSLIAQLEITYTDGRRDVIITDDTWLVAKGPIRLSEIYNGEKFDATLEIGAWSSPLLEQSAKWNIWRPASALSWLPDTTHLVAGFSEPVRRISIVKPIARISTPSGKTILDFGQNLVGYTRIKSVKGQKGQKIVLRHAEVLENGELGVRPLRDADATDEYILKGSDQPESWEPRFTFHGYRFLQVEGWTPELDCTLLSSLEAVVCHTDMTSTGDFSCSDSLVNQLFKNIRWSMRGNFLSLPTDCPQRDERLGYTGDLALFAPTACFVYDCSGILKNWLVDVAYAQKEQGGVPPIVAPNVLRIGGKNSSSAIWGDVTILAPWTLYEAFGDKTILESQYDSMTSYLGTIQKNKTGLTQLWDSSLFQLGDWLDPKSSPDAPWSGQTDPILVANIFLVRVLDLVARIAVILDKDEDAKHFRVHFQAARDEFRHEYVTSSGRLVSDSQTAYALAICFDILSELQLARAGERLAEIVRRNEFRIGTGFAGTPFVCEALARTGHIQVAYAMLRNDKCPSWLYPVSLGATTVWERWDSMLSDGSINPGEMTSFNHYAFGAIAKFLHERLAGLQCMKPGWALSRVAPLLGGGFTSASASHITPYGLVSSSWRIMSDSNAHQLFTLTVRVPPNTRMQVILPSGQEIEIDGFCETSFSVPHEAPKGWPVEPIRNLPSPAS